MVGLGDEQTFRLRKGGVFCDEHGLSVGSVALLCNPSDEKSYPRWSIRPVDEINCDLAAIYGVPVDVASKTPSLVDIARALTNGDLVRAAVGAVLLGLPEPLSLEKRNASGGALTELVTALRRSRVLKADWDPSKHPRTGTPPNSGWFAPGRAQKETAPKEEDIPKEENALATKEENEPVAEPDKSPRLFGWPARVIRLGLREVAKYAGVKLISSLATAGAAALSEGGTIFLQVIEDLGPTELNRGEQKILDEWHALSDPPKTLEQLQAKPTVNKLGYDLHHIVEQNPANVEKTDIEKFTQERLDAPDNLVWIPRLKHERITAYFSSKPRNGLLGGTNRNIIKQKSFDEQRAIGLELLRREGILQ